jgi:predicted ATP-dependent serine protease
MNPIFKKLNFKDQKVLHIVNAPESFSQDSHEMLSLASIKNSLTSAKEVSFFLAFVTKQKEVEDWSALRFRKPENIKKMTRSFAMTAEGKKKVAAAKRAAKK